MASPTLDKTSPIVIVGAGVFGLSTALHLAERGYTKVTILDKQSYHESQYSYSKGCDAASAGTFLHFLLLKRTDNSPDINKIIRSAYGSQVEYQTLALDAMTHWKKWNEEIKQGKTLPPGFTTQDAIFVNNGNVNFTSDAGLPEFEKVTIENMTKVGLGKTQIVLTNPEDVKHAKASGFGFAVNPFNRKSTYGLLDLQGGFVYSDKACRFALHKAQKLGVRTILGGAEGTFSHFLRDANSRILGVQTSDGVSHSAELTIMACGGWTPSLVTQLDNLCETTAGSVCIFHLPPGSPLWDRFAPENFPTWT